MDDQGRILKLHGSKCDRDASSRIPLQGEVSLEASKAERGRLKKEAVDKLLKIIDFKKVTYQEISSPQWKEKIEDSIGKAVNEIAEGADIGSEQRAILLQEVHDEILGLGPLEELLADPDINEVMVNGMKRIYVEKRGRIELSGKTFTSDDLILSVLDRILVPLGKRIDPSSPTVDARLKDGSRVHAIIPPLSLNGPIITIRKFSKKALSIEDLINFGALTREAADFLKLAVEKRKNIVVSGGTGSGKTTLLNVLSTFISPLERIIVIEDSSELKLIQDHILYLEARPPNIEGKGAISIRELVRNSLRMRPDRIVVGECRGGEAIDMLQAMNTGHDGCMTTLHSNSPRDTLARLETMILMSGFELPIRAVREQIASAVDIIVHVSRTSQGRRLITSITEVCGTEDTVITTQELFRLQKSDPQENNDGGFHLEATGNFPKFLNANDRY
jgi:pilus assembly protein CpaF